MYLLYFDQFNAGQILLNKSINFGRWSCMVVISSHVPNFQPQYLLYIDII